MIKRLGNRHLRIAVGALYALAMVLMVYAHQPLSAAPDIDLSDYSLPDGSAPVLCLDASAPDSEPSPVLFDGGCDACRLTAAPGLPAQSPALTNGSWLPHDRILPAADRTPRLKSVRCAPPARSPPAQAGASRPA